MQFFSAFTMPFSPAYTAVSNEALDEAFLSRENISIIEEKGETTAWKQNRRPLSRIFYAFPWFLSFILLVALIWMDQSRRASYCEITFGFDEMVYSPAQDIIEPQNVVFTSGFVPEVSIYQGPSSPERDQAWEDLYSYGISRIPKSSAARLVNKTVPIPDDPDHYVVMLKVFHQLHCLNMLRLRLWSNGTFDPSNILMSMDHLSHCMDSLRQALMCSSDITPIPWSWNYETKEAKPVADIQHSCRNFNKVKEWARENHVKSFNPKVYVEDDLNP
ncbi:hypothetical protein CPB83DRAFT_810742 [Crepidotus variabilis]|uniref:Tat pathway signal sequence n=1 Tax=Crepidotus variabilis TaxID=179855 RepID=A0A9P6EK42_9AGAR|nr:hypothetical protein CPB83DRAFT_810742 [Crepidotus variabilis]